MGKFLNFLTEIPKLINLSSNEQKAQEERLKVINSILDSPHEMDTELKASLIKKRQALIFYLVSRIKTDNPITWKSLIELSNHSPFNWGSIRTAFPELKRNEKDKLIKRFSLFQKASAYIVSGSGLIMFLIGGFFS